MQTDTDDVVVSWMRLAFTPKIGPKTFFNLVRIFGCPKLVFENLDEIQQKYKLTITPLSISQIEDEIAKCEKFCSKIILSCDPAYPALLLETQSPPAVLIVKGDLSLLSREKIAIVGTRNASLHGEKIANGIAKDLGRNNIVVVSGLARGIDAAAHYGGLEHGTIGVVAGGINCIYPKENIKLYNELYERGLIISENLMDTPPVSKNFPRRNRIISGISRGVLVVEAKQRSGTIITANYALEQGRDVFAIPGSPHDPRAQGTNNLIKSGAILVQTAQDILDELSCTHSARKIAQSDLFDDDVVDIDVSTSITTDMDDQCTHVKHDILSKLSNIPVDIDDLFRVVALSVSDFNSIISELEVEGLVIRSNDNKIALENQIILE